MSEVLALQLEDDLSGNGEEAMMQDFVRLHMMSIMQPFAERVKALQDQLILVGDSQHQHQSLLKHLETRAQVQEEETQRLQQEGAARQQQLEAQQAELSSVKKERNRLEGNHEITKAAVAKNREALAEVQTARESLEQRYKHSEERLAACFEGLRDLEQRLLERFDTRLDKQGTTCKNLNEKQAELQKLCMQSKGGSERANAAVNQLTVLQESLKKEFADFTEGTRQEGSQVRERIAGLEEQLQQQGKALTDTNREVAHLRTWTDELKELHELSKAQAEVHSEVKAAMQRYAGLELRLAELGQPDPEVEALREQLRLLQQRLDQTSAEVSKGKDVQKAHLDLLSSAGNRLQELEASVPSLREQVTAAHGQFEDLGGWRQETGQQLMEAKHQLRRCEAQVGELQAGVKEIGSGQEELRQEQTSARESLTKMSGRLDLCNKYFSGLGKGLKDAHNQIVGVEGGLLPKTGEQAHALPPLMPGPRTPRTSRQNSLPSPRR